ncbi:MAG: hypothetical protein LC126_06730 [Bryobacterales bacterium]|nr:hypothetical protein [Bryobacterales bacterium]
MEDAVEKLSPIYRSVFVLRELEEPSAPETAEGLGVTEETAKDASPSRPRVPAAKAQTHHRRGRKAGPSPMVSGGAMR